MQGGMWLVIPVVPVVALGGKAGMVATVVAMTGAPQLLQGALVVVAKMGFQMVVRAVVGAWDCEARATAAQSSAAGGIAAASGLKITTTMAVVAAGARMALVLAGVPMGAVALAGWRLMGLQPPLVALVPAASFGAPIVPSPPPTPPEPCCLEGGGVAMTQEKPTPCRATANAQPCLAVP